MGVILETERLILRNYELSDFNDYWEMVSMKGVGPRAGWPAYTDKAKAYERLQYEVSKPLQFALIYKKNNKLIGAMEIMDVKKERFTNDEIPDGSKEIGAIMSEKYWGMGLGTECLQKLIQYCFDVLNVPAVYTCHAKANIGSGKMQEKCGLKEYSEVENFKTWIDGTTTSLIKRVMTKEDYEEIYGKERK